MEKQEKKKINSKFIIILAAMLLIGGGYGFYVYNHGLHHETTDDAQIDAKISPINPKVSGYIKEVKIKDNQWVKKGDTLLVLDDAEYQLKLQQAEAALNIAKSQLTVASANVGSSSSILPINQANAVSVQANVATANANIEAAKVGLWRATNDFERYNNLYKEKSVTKQQFEQAQAAKETAEKQLQVLQDTKNAISKQANVAASQIGNTKSQIAAVKSQMSVANANISQAQTNVDNAQLFLSYNVIIAPEDGQISTVNLQVGQLIQAGQTVLMLVGVQNQWVVANFKETQMNKVRTGQKVDIEVDAFPNYKIEGQIESIAPATGSKFALLPPDNASGNYVKTIQRIPVRITLKKGDGDILKLIRPGMNVLVDVNI